MWEKGEERIRQTSNDKGRYRPPGFRKWIRLYMLLTAKLPAISPLQKGMKFLPVQKVQGARKIWGNFFVKNMSGGLCPVGKCPENSGRS